MPKTIRRQKSQRLAVTDTITSSTKFNLFLKTHQIKQVSDTLQHVMLLPKRKRQSWIREHGELVHQAFDNLVDDSNNLLDNLQLDEETLELSQELVVSLRDAMNLVENILYDQHQLKS
jgi:hypothetical protein